MQLAHGLFRSGSGGFCPLTGLRTTCGSIRTDYHSILGTIVSDSPSSTDINLPTFVDRSQPTPES